MITFDASLITDREPDQKTALLFAEEIEETDNSAEGFRFFRGVFFGTIFNVPIWALILWIVL